MPPVFTTLDAFTITENDPTVAQIFAQDDQQRPLTIVVTGGADGHLFLFNPETSELEFLQLPDFEEPLDAGRNNVYDLEVTATDAFGATTVQAIQVTVTDLADPGVTRRGGSGADQFAGGTGADVLIGGGGKDRLFGNAGTDTLQGDAGDDLLIGHGGSDLLLGGAGRDTLDGGVGSNRLEGGAGVDLFVIGGMGVQDTTIADFTRGETIQMRTGDFDNFTELRAASVQQGGDVVITLDDGSLTLENVQLSSLRASDFLFF